MVDGFDRSKCMAVIIDSEIIGLLGGNNEESNL
jgi:hypothetical protein